MLKKLSFALLLSGVAVVAMGQFPQPTGSPTNPQIGCSSTGTTGAVVGTCAATAGKTNVLCGFNVQAIGGTAAVGPITVAGLTGGSQVYQASATAGGGKVAGELFIPCLAATGPNVAITITTTADGTATAVDVNGWGYQF